MRNYSNNWLSSFNNSTLQLVLFVTEKCNFRCVYCYEDFKLGKIEDFVIEGIKNLIIERISELDVLKVSYFGGEPLLNIKAVRQISKFSQKISYDNNLRYEGSITTNGFRLSKPLFHELVDLGISEYQVTLDGDKKTHDKLRPLGNGGSTFDSIYENLIHMSNSSKDFKCTIRFNVSDESFFGVKNFIENLSYPFKNDNRFIISFHPIFGMKELKITKDKELNQLRDLVLNNNLLSSHMLSNGDKYVCYAAKPNSFVIRADGVIQKCTVALDKESNRIGQIFKSGKITLNKSKLDRWIFSENKSCPVQEIGLQDKFEAYEKAGKFDLTHMIQE